MTKTILLVIFHIKLVLKNNNFMCNLKRFQYVIDFNIKWYY